jgi:hypothetical protein
LPNAVFVLFLEPDFVPVAFTEPVIFAVVLPSLSVGLSDPVVSDSVAEAVSLAEDSSVEAVAPLDALDAAVDLGASVADGSAVSAAVKSIDAP